MLQIHVYCIPGMQNMNLPTSKLSMVHYARDQAQFTDNIHCILQSHDKVIFFQIGGSAPEIYV